MMIRNTCTENDQNFAMERERDASKELDSNNDPHSCTSKHPAVTGTRGSPTFTSPLRVPKGNGAVLLLRCLLARLLLPMLLRASGRWLLEFKALVTTTGGNVAESAISPSGN